MQVLQSEIDTLNSTESGQSILAFSKDLVPASHKKLLRSLAHGSGNQVEVFPEDIRIIEGFNPRLRTPEFEAHIRSVADSIIENGFYPDKPLAGYAGMEGSKPVIFLTDGEVRYRASLIAIDEGAPLEVLPLVLKPEGTSIEDLTVALVRSNSGKPFTPLELSIVCARLRKFGWTAAKISTKLGITIEYVGQLLLLAGAPRAVRDMVESGSATAGVAIQAMRQHGADAPEVLTKALESAKSSGQSKLTRRHLPEQVRKKAIVMAAPKMLSALQEISQHKSYAKLPEDLKAKVSDLLKAIPEVSDAPHEDGHPGENNDGVQAQTARDRDLLNINEKL